MRRSVDTAQIGYDCVYGLPNERTAAVCTRADLQRLGVVQRFARPLASREKLGQRIPPWLALFITPWVDRATGCGFERARGAALGTVAA